MPIEIRELHIKVKVNERQNQPQRPTDKTARTQEKKASEEALIAECVAQTLQILKNNKER